MKKGKDYGLGSSLSSSAWKMYMIFLWLWFVFLEFYGCWGMIIKLQKKTWFFDKIPFTYRGRWFLFYGETNRVSLSSLLNTKVILRYSRVQLKHHPIPSLLAPWSAHHLLGSQKRMKMAISRDVTHKIATRLKEAVLPRNFLSILSYNEDFFLIFFASLLPSLFTPLFALFFLLHSSQSSVPPRLRNISL